MIMKQCGLAFEPPMVNGMALMKFSQHLFLLELSIVVEVITISYWGPTVASG